MGTETGIQRKKPASPLRHWSLWTVVLLAGAASLSGWLVARDHARQALEAEFHKQADGLVDALTLQFGRTELLLDAARGLHDASEFVSREEWRAFVGSLDIEDGAFPGLLGVAYVEAVEDDEVQDFLFATRDQGLFDFDITPVPGQEPGSGFHAVIKYLYPEEPNRAAIGRDLWTYTPSKEALQLAMETDRAAATRRVELMARDANNAGIVVYLPVFTSESEASETSEVEGWVAAPIAASDLIDPLLLGDRAGLCVELRDHTGATLYECREHDHGVQAAAEYEVKISLGGREMSLAIHDPSALFGAETSVLPMLAAVAGSVLTALLGATCWSLLRTRARAESLAERMTGSLRRSEQIARATLDGLEAFVAILDADGRVLAANSQWRDRVETGAPLPCMVAEGQSAIEACESDRGRGAIQSAHIANAVREMVSGDRPSFYEEHSVVVHGSSRWYAVRLTRCQAEEEVRVVLACEDVTERIDAEDTVRRSEERFELALQGSSDGFWDWNIPEHTIWFSPRLFELMGYENGEFESTFDAWESRIHEDDRDRVLQALRSHLAERVPYDVEYRSAHKDGGHRWFRARGQAQWDESGKPARMSGSLSDITRLKEQQRELERQRDLFKRTEAISRVGGWSVDPETGLCEWSDEIYRIYETTRDEYDPMVVNSIEAYDEPGRAELAEALDYLMQTGEPFDMELPFTTIKGSKIWVRAQGEAEFVDGRAVRLSGTCQNITARREREEQLRKYTEELLESRAEVENQRLQLAMRSAELERARVEAEAANLAKSEFLANMSHEIRTPMTAILGFADLLLEEGDQSQAPAARIEQINTIRNNGKHLLSLVNDILDLSKIEAGQMQIERVETSIASVVREVERMMRERAADKDVTFELEWDGQIPGVIRSDPIRLRQIIVNLVGNAVKFTESGSVVIRTSFGPDDSVMSVEVRDTGIGMTPEQTDRIFRAFTQADTSVTRRFGGTGLGLTISKRLAHALGGDITVESELGQGSVFTLSFTAEQPGELIDPASEEEQQPETTEPLAAPLNGGRLNARILLAEDGPDNQRLVSFHLRKAGASVEIVDDGQQAVDAIERAEQEGRAFDLLLLDMQMPVMDGYTAARTLRDRGWGGPIVALTAHAMAGDRERCLEAGCDAYATKPIEKTTLIGLCHEWAGQHRRGAA